MATAVCAHCLRIFTIKRPVYGGEGFVCCSFACYNGEMMFQDAVSDTNLKSGDIRTDLDEILRRYNKE